MSISSTEKLYKGKAGQLYLMSLLLTRGWNVAIPEIDTGDDIFVVKDRTQGLRKIQVKTTYTITKTHKGFKVKFNVPGQQLVSGESIELIYAFIIFHDNAFYKDMFLIQRDMLQQLLSSVKKKELGMGNVNFYIEFKNKEAFSQSKNITEHINDFSFFPSQF